MSRASRFVAVVVAAVCAASPAVAMTALLPIDVGATNEGAAAAVDAAFAAVLGPDLKRVAAGTDPGRDLARCHQNLACLQRVAADAGADEVAWVSFANDGDGAGVVVKLALFGPDGAPLATFSAASDDDARALAAAAFAPASYVGHVAIFGVEHGDEVLLDGLRPPAADAHGAVAVRVGSHVVTVDRADGSVDRVAFVVPFDDIVRVAVPSSSSFSVPTQTPVVAEAAVAVAAAAGVTFLVGRELLWADAAARLAGVCGNTDEDPTGNGYAGQGVDSLGVCAAPHIEDRQWVQLNRDLHLRLGIGLAGVAVAGGVAAALSFAATTNPQPE